MHPLCICGTCIMAVLLGASSSAGSQEPIAPQPAEDAPFALARLPEELADIANNIPARVCSLTGWLPQRRVWALFRNNSPVLARLVRSAILGSLAGALPMRTGKLARCPLRRARRRAGTTANVVVQALQGCASGPIRFFNTWQHAAIVHPAPPRHASIDGRRAQAHPPEITAVSQRRRSPTPGSSVGFWRRGST